MNNFDLSVSAFLNRAAQKSELFDQTVVFLSNSDLAKGAVLVGAVWAMWFFAKGDQEKNRSLLLAAIVGALATMFFARVIAFITPHRVRPLLEPALHFLPPKGLPAQTNWTSWSSFPSDHAALFVALAVGVWLVSSRVGAVLLAYVAIGILLPRLYIGIHYVSDELGGAALGALIVAVCATEPLRRMFLVPIVRWSERHPALFYFLFYLITFQIATLFWDFRVALALCGIST